MSNDLPKINWCSRCVYPSSSAVTLTFNENKYVADVELLIKKRK